MALPGPEDSSNSDLKKVNSDIMTSQFSVPPGSIRARSNVTLRKNNDSMVPGELLYTYRPRSMDRESRDRATDLQFDEKMYYAACANCKQAPCQCRAP